MIIKLKVSGDNTTHPMPSGGPVRLECEWYCLDWGNLGTGDKLVPFMPGW